MKDNGLTQLENKIKGDKKNLPIQSVEKGGHTDGWTDNVAVIPMQIAWTQKMEADNGTHQETGKGKKKTD